MRTIVKSLFTWDEVWKEFLLNTGSFFFSIFMLSRIGGFPQNFWSIAVMALASLIVGFLLPNDKRHAFFNMQTRSRKCFASVMIVISFYTVAAISPGVHLVTGDFAALRDICLTIVETIESWALYVGLLMIIGFIFFYPLIDALMDLMVDNPLVLSILLASIAMFLGITHISGLVTLLGICWQIIAPWVIIGIASITAYFLIWHKQVRPDHRWF